MATSMSIVSGAGAERMRLWAFATSVTTWLIVKLTTGRRVSEEEEWEGVDVGECGLEAYPAFAGAPGSGM